MKRFIVFAVLGCACISALAQRVPPPHVQSQLFAKLLPYYTNLADQPFTIHVINANQVASELKKFVGKKIGNAVLTGVTTGRSVPDGGAQVVYLNRFDQEIIDYSLSHKMLTITGNPSLVEKGVTLGVGMSGKKTKVYLNLESSKKAGIQWNPTILRVSEKVGQ
jgi:hypothetical protein